MDGTGKVHGIHGVITVDQKRVTTNNGGGLGGGGDLEFLEFSFWGPSAMGLG